jgi:hypothetical protein
MHGSERSGWGFSKVEEGAEAERPARAKRGINVYIVVVLAIMIML